MRVIGDILVDDPPWNLVELEQHYSARHRPNLLPALGASGYNTAGRDHRNTPVLSGFSRLRRRGWPAEGHVLRPYETAVFDNETESKHIGPFG